MAGPTAVGSGPMPGYEAATQCCGSVLMETLKLAVMFPDATNFDVSQRWLKVAPQTPTSKM